MDAQFKSDERDLWEVDNTYVIGHQRPDTDAIASALGYAWFLSATGAERTVAARAGQLPAQTTFALRRFGCAAPPLLTTLSKRRRLCRARRRFPRRWRKWLPALPSFPLSMSKTSPSV
jgi:hypothetical protein